MRTPLFPGHPTLRSPTTGPLLGTQAIVVAPAVGCDVKGIKQLWRTLRPVGVRVAVATETHGEVVGDDGRQMTPNFLVIEVRPLAWDALVIAGGRGAALLADDVLVRELAMSFRAAGRFVGAFGTGRLVLERAGVEGIARERAEELAPAIVAALTAIRLTASQPTL
jgi:putative intracellular protease/amidase